MPFNFAEDTAVADGASIAEDALALLEFVRANRRARIDLGSCTHVHTAVLQVLLATRPTIVATPEEAFLARWLSPELERPNTGAN